MGSYNLSSENEQILLSPKGRLWVDVEAFEEAAAAARRSLDPAAYRAAIELYAGELLPRDLYENWAEARRQDLRATHLSLLVELAGLYEEWGEYRLAIDASASAAVRSCTKLRRLYPSIER
jgi:DNA-binding SARP family transcriptional activator